MEGEGALDPHGLKLNSTHPIPHPIPIPILFLDKYTGVRPPFPAHPTLPHPTHQGPPPFLAGITDSLVLPSPHTSLAVGRRLQRPIPAYPGTP